MAVTATPTEYNKSANDVRPRVVCENLDQDVADAYATWHLIDTRHADTCLHYVKCTDPGTDTLKYKIQASRKDADAASLVDGDFFDVVAETSLAVGAEASYTFVMDVTGYSAMRMQLKNAVALSLSKATTYGKAFYGRR